MKKLSIAISIVFAVFLIMAAQPNTPPGQDPCNHGNSNQPCRPDPQPSHGKDCLRHGNNGGVNEDHCSPISSPSPSISPRPTSTPNPTPTPISTPVPTILPTPTPEPTPTGSLVPPVVSEPEQTLPPTDTE